MITALINNLVVEKILETLISQRIEICELLGEESLPIQNPPISPDALVNLKRFWVQMGGSMPDDYEAFLQICDGIGNFSSSYHLFGSETFELQNYHIQTELLLKNGIGLPKNPMTGIIFLGWHDETNTRIFYDFNSEVPCLYDGEPGFLSKYDSFMQFLNLKVTSNEIIIKKMSDMQSDLSEEDDLAD